MNEEQQLRKANEFQRARSTRDAPDIHRNNPTTQLQSTKVSSSNMLASLYNSMRGHMKEDGRHPLPCPRTSKAYVDQLSKAEINEMWLCLNNIYCTAIGRAESIGRCPNDQEKARKIIKFLTGTRAQKAWDSGEVVITLLVHID
ncbi:MAG: hypothetical protein EOP53_10740 [Sphingobacteriales bacterium]|nr:MAG: hypothetical protein EOP53_10740 [Sphingobacteriales bacterium]